MEIRSVTLFCEASTDLAAYAPFLQAARAAFAYPVQTLRLAMPPFADWWVGAPDDAVQAQQLAAQWQAAGGDYVCLGPVQLQHEAGWLQRLPTILSATNVLFASVEIANQDGLIDLERCQDTARLIQQVSQVQDNGFGNLYLTAVANCPPGSPFFPVAYHQGGPSHFALAVEAADLALQAIQTAQSLAAARANLIQAIEVAAAHLTTTANHLAAQWGIRFSGIDFSLAPFPMAARSLAGALEALGIPHVGAAGSLFAAGFITEALDRAHFPRCGFCGLMLPVLEDSVLARRAAEGRLTMADLLSYSAVCGVGLDTIPLPGEVTTAQLTAVLLDMAMLAARLDKPLTARLMPLPGLQAGDPVAFDFPYFANSCIMPLAGDGVAGLMQEAAQLPVNPIRRISDRLGRR